MNKLYSVHDHWTDINKKNDVDIESIDGVITGIKVNGEDYGGGESDFSTAEVTVVKKYGNSFTINASSAVDNDEAHASVPATDSSDIGDRTKLKIILYKGNAVMRISGFPLGEAPTITTSGNVQYIEFDDIYIISGDCTITIS